MEIRLDKEKNRVYINKKEYALVAEYNDPEFGHILKCCTLKFKNYAVFFLIEEAGKYHKITNEQIFSKIVKKYEKAATGIIED